MNFYVTLHPEQEMPLVHPRMDCLQHSNRLRQTRHVATLKREFEAASEMVATTHVVATNPNGIRRLHDQSRAPAFSDSPGQVLSVDTLVTSEVHVRSTRKERRVGAPGSWESKSLGGAWHRRPSSDRLNAVLDESWLCSHRRDAARRPRWTPWLLQQLVRQYRRPSIPTERRMYGWMAFTFAHPRDMCALHVHYTHSSYRPASMLTTAELRTTTASPSRFTIQLSSIVMFCVVDIREETQ